MCGFIVLDPCFGAVSSLAIIFAEEEGAGSFTCIVLWLSVLCVSSSRCRGLVCSLCLWYMLIYFLIYPPLRNGTLQNKDIMRDRTLINKGIIQL